MVFALFKDNSYSFKQNKNAAKYVIPKLKISDDRNDLLKEF